VHKLKTYQDVIAFLDYCKEKGLMNSSSAAAKKSSVARVFGAMSEDDIVDINLVDVEELMKRFSNKYGKEYTPDSLQTYKARIKTSIEDFVRYEKNPMSFRMVEKSQAKPRQQKANSERPSASHSESDSIRQDQFLSPAMLSAIPIPIREGLVVSIVGLPYDLTESEASRITNIIRAYTN
jgi:hypothetical protein